MKQNWGKSLLLKEKRVIKLKEGKITVYETRKIITYSKEDILEEMGPAQARSPRPCPVTP
jgi:hypothetical protein